MRQNACFFGTEEQRRESIVKIVRVAVALMHADKGILDYRVPESLLEQAQIGTRVEVPLGRGHRLVQGYIVAFATDEGALNYKTIAGVLDEVPLLSLELVQLALWVSERYIVPAFLVLEYILPKFARQIQEVVYQFVAQPEEYDYHRIFLSAQSERLADALRKEPKTQRQLLKMFGNDYQAYLEPLLNAKLVETTSRFKQQGGSKKTYCYQSLLEPEELATDWVQKRLGRARKQRELLQYLAYEGPLEGRKLQKFWPNYRELTKALLEKELISRQEIMSTKTSEETTVFYNDAQLVLNNDQQVAAKQIVALLDANRYRSVLIHGVTGSGKTEIYLHSIKHALIQNKGVLVLVPEIALTPQLIGRFASVLDVSIAVLHSSLSDGQRYEVWQGLKQGQIKVVIGVRSAVFAPVENLGLIIMDEEHETTFKQSEPDPRYHARDVALKRGEMNQAVVILGSATPSIQSYYRALTGEHLLLTLKKRAKAQSMPAVDIVNMAQEFKAGNRSIFSRQLQMAVEEAIKKGEQVILYLNRRGFASSVVCRECGYTMMCRKCNIALTYHKGQNVLKCHYCDYIVPNPKHCPNCGSQFIRHFGSGTQLVEEQVRKTWPYLQTVRMDMDTTQNKNAHQKILEIFAKGEAQILIGTQMITKGLDFPNVTVVGVIAADITLNMPDYTASERNFQLLTQVAGRAGRGDKQGVVVVQTYNAEHYSILCAQKHDYEAFYQQEIRNRQLLEYPPFTVLARFLLSDFDEQEAQRMATLLGDFLAEHYPQIERLGPSAAPIEKIRERYRYHLVLKHHDLNLLLEAANRGQIYMNVSRKSKTLRIVIDVEPQSIL